jgi:hypothetical protein
LTQNEYIFNNLLIALSAGALFWSNNAFSLSAPCIQSLLAVVLLTFAVYSYFRKCIPIILTGTIALLGAVFMFSSYPSIPQVSLIALASLLLIFYPYLRKITGIKNLTIALVWSFVTCFNLQPEDIHFSSTFLSIACWVFSLSLLNDLLDFKADQNHINTLPIRMGRKPTFALSLLFVGVAHHFLPNPNYWHFLLWMGLFCCFSFQKKTLLYHLVEVSSLILVILQFLSVFYDKS